MRKLKTAGIGLLGLLVVLAAVLLLVPREERIQLLYATNGSSYDRSAYDNFRQTLVANVRMNKADLAGISDRKLQSYDAVYLDVSLAGTDGLKDQVGRLTQYVRSGGHLFLENEFAGDFPLDLLGAKELREIVLPDGAPKLALRYPEVDPNLQDLQKLVHLFTDSFNQHVDLTTMPGFRMGKGVVPDTAVSLASVGNVSILSANRYGQGTVMLCSGFLPNRYFITGFDMQSGMDPSRGFASFAKQYDALHPLQKGVQLFSFKDGLPMQPYFNFDFATANDQLRGAFLDYVSKEKLGYSIDKVLGPYGRPALAFENHFEALSAFRDEEAIHWAELLKSYNEIPTFSLVRASYDWGVWKEGIVAHLNAGTSDKPQFTGEYANSFYSSGAFLMAGGQTLTGAQYPQSVQLAEPITLPYRAYPALADLTGDGKPDLVVGSADGSLRVYANAGTLPDAYAGQPLPSGTSPPDAFAAAKPLTLPSGEPLTVPGGYAAPAVADADGDGTPDLVIGAGDGRVWLARGLGGQRFAAPVPLDAGGAPVRAAADAAPAAGDADGDGTPDLVVGAGDGSVTLYRGVPGKPGVLEAGRVIVRTGGHFAAPSLRDMNGDGRPDLVIGSDEGDLQVYLQQPDGSWTGQGPVEGQTLNQMGTKALVGGHNSVPLWYDINHDGKDDLLVGQLQFGDAVPIDDPRFPYQAQLKDFLNYAASNKLELLPHVFVHNFMSAEQEQKELALQKQSFAKLGLPWSMTGTNQHTWRLNLSDRLQTLRDENGAGIWYNFGFRVPEAPDDPHEGYEYAWQLPFLLQDDQLKTPMLLNSPVLRFDKDGSAQDIFQGMAALDMPIDYFEHIEYSFPATAADTGPTAHSAQERSDKLNKSLLPFVQYFDRFRTTEDYNFMTEPQMAESFLATLQGGVTVRQSWAAYLWDKLRDKLGKGVHVTLTIRASQSGVSPLAGDYRNTLGVVVKPGRRFAGQPLGVDADVFAEKGDAVYAGLNRSARLTVNWKPEPYHVIRSNVPLSLTRQGDTFTYRLNGDGMQQLKLYSPYPLAITGPDLKVDEDAEDKTYTVTHFGAAVSVKVQRKQP